MESRQPFPLIFSGVSSNIIMVEILFGKRVYFSDGIINTLFVS